MERLIPILNKLQDVTDQCKLAIELPQIVVVGSQSSGKSSVLESLVGRDFLPRGSGIVTRRPLVLQLRKEDTEEWAEFGHIPGERFTDFREVLKEIESATRDVTGDRGISSTPIHLKIHSPKVVDITLVDLPGITKVPVGDQPRNIEELIRNMVLEYITSPNSLILAITAANSDLANSDSLKLAKEVDPEGVRTLGVLTKIDLMDRGTDAMEMLENRVYPLRLGYVGVVCRSQEDIAKKVPMKNHLGFERTFFANHPKYSKIASRLGTEFLAKRLNSLLIAHLKERLPLLKKRVSEMLVDKEAELRSYGQPLADAPSSQGAILLNLLQRFQKAYSDMIEGRTVKPSSVELEGGARINSIFNNEYKAELRSMSPFDDLSDVDIRTTLLNSTGIRQALFIPETAFEILAKKQISRLLEPSLRCADRVYRELQEMVSRRMDFPELDRFHTLRDALVEVVNDLLKKCLKPTIKMITNLVDIEQAYINIQHPDFIGGSAALSAVNQEMLQRASEEAKSASLPPSLDASPISQGTNYLLNMIPYKGKEEQEAGKQAVMQVSTPPTNREIMETEVVKKMLDSYFQVVLTNLSDLVPKTITCKLVSKSMMELHAELVSRLYKPELYEELMTESGDIPVRRMRCQEEIRRLVQAREVLAEVREYSG